MMLFTFPFPFPFPFPTRPESLPPPSCDDIIISCIIFWTELCESLASASGTDTAIALLERDAVGDWKGEGEGLGLGLGGGGTVLEDPGEGIWIPPAAAYGFWWREFMEF